MRKLALHMALALGFLAMVGTVLPTGALWAEPRDEESARNALKRGEIIPYGQIVKRVERLFDGRIVGQRVRQLPRGQWIYDLKVLTPDGTVIEVIMDARTGRVLGSEGKRK